MNSNTVMTRAWVQEPADSGFVQWSCSLRCSRTTCSAGSPRIPARVSPSRLSAASIRPTTGSPPAQPWPNDPRRVRDRHPSHGDRRISRRMAREPKFGLPRHHSTGKLWEFSCAPANSPTFARWPAPGGPSLPKLTT